MSASPTASSTPEAAPTIPLSPEVTFENIKTDTTGALNDLKLKLEVDESNPEQQEWLKIKEFFTTNKDTIKKITQAELDQLKTEINDNNSELPGILEVTEGIVNYNETPTTPSETPETITEYPPLAQFQANLPQSAQDEITNYQPKTTNSVGNLIRDAIVNFIAGFAPEWAARIRGFTNSNMEKRAEASYNVLNGDEMRNTLSNSPLSSIIVLDHIDKNDFKKILSQYPNLDFSNTQNIEAAFLGKHSGKPELIKYHRIYEGMRQMSGDLSGTDSMSYNPEERLKELLNYSRDETMDANISFNTPIPLLGPPNTLELPNTEEVVPEIIPDSLEVQTSLIKQAQELDVAVITAQAMPESTDDEKKTRESDLKKAQEASKQFQGERKNSIVTTYVYTSEILVEKDNKEKILKLRSSPNEEDKKELEATTKEIQKLTAIKEKIEAEMSKVMTKKEENWEIKPNIKAEDMVSVEIAVSMIEKNTVVVENQEISEDEKKNQEKEKQEKQKQIEIEEKLKKPREIYQKLKQDKNGYLDDEGEGYVYTLNEKGEMFRYDYDGGFFDTPSNWINGLISDDDLPRDTFSHDIIYKINKDGNWIDSGFKTNSWSGESQWQNRTNRIRMKNQAPDNLLSQ